MLALYLLMKKTRFGQALRATIQHRDAARLVGIDTDRIAGYGFGLGLATAAVGGTALALDSTIYPSLHWHWIGPLMAIIVVGGLGSVPGAAIAAMVLGMLQSLLQIPFGTTWAQTDLLRRAVRDPGVPAAGILRRSPCAAILSQRAGSARVGSVVGRRSLVGAVWCCRSRRWRPNPYILSVGRRASLNYAVLSTVVELRRRVHRVHLARARRACPGSAPTAPALLVTKAGLPSFVALSSPPLHRGRCWRFRSASRRCGCAGASFVIVSIALVLILLLVFQSWASFTGGSRGLVVPRPFPDLLRPEHHRVFFFLFAGLLAVALLAWWLIDRSRFGLGLKAIREDEDKAQALGMPTFAYKLVVFVVSAAFTALAGGMYALWFGDLDPVFQFSILTGSYMVLMALLGGVRHLFGPLLGALIVGNALEYFKVEYGDTPLHLVATGLLLGVVVMFMPDGVIPAIVGAVRPVLPARRASIREVTAAELLESDRPEADATRAGSAGAAAPRGRRTDDRGPMRTATTAAARPACAAWRRSSSPSPSAGSPRSTARR